MFLACTAGHPVTPSDQVDQVWHLHLLYTRSYWDEFCRKALRQDLHHGPTVGGTEAREQYTDWYGKTLEAYAKTFGTAAPAAYWPDPAQRMAETEFVRVNTHRNWVVPKWWR